MEMLLLAATLLIVCRNFAQCPSTVGLTSSNDCPGATLTVRTADILAKIVWYKDGFPVETVLSGAGYIPSGIVVAGGNGPGTDPRQLTFPQQLFVDPAGNLYVADENNNRIQRFTPGSLDGVTVAGGNGNGAAANQLDFPVGMALDGAGNLYIADIYNNRIQKWAQGGSTGVTVAGGNGLGSAANQLSNPRFVWLDAQGNIFVSDDAGDIVREFTRQTGINDTYTAAVPGVYSAVVTDAAGCVVTANSITIVPSVTATVSIAASANPVCSGTPVAFAASR